MPGAGGRNWPWTPLSGRLLLCLVELQLLSVLWCRSSALLQPRSRAGANRAVMGAEARGQGSHGGRGWPPGPGWDHGRGQGGGLRQAQRQAWAEVDTGIRVLGAFRFGRAQALVALRWVASSSTSSKHFMKPCLGLPRFWAPAATTGS